MLFTLNNEMFSHTDLKKGAIFIYKAQPHQVLEHSLVFKGRGRSNMQVKIKNLTTGSVLNATFHAGDSFEEAELKKKKLSFAYTCPVRAGASNGTRVVFAEKDSPSKRLKLTKEQVGPGVQFLKQNQEVEGLVFEDKIISIALPVKVCLKVVEAPPGVRAGRAEAGTKLVALETGAKINAPLFIKQGDIIELNTQSGLYIRRVE